MQIYVVKPGDSVDSIAAEFGVNAESVIYNNQIPPPYSLAVGQALLLSVPGDENPRRLIRTNGYAYPYISRWVLEQTLPFLTELSIFSYGFTAEGDVIPPALDDTPLIELALAEGTLPILTLTPFGPDGRFNNALISSVVQNPDKKRRLILQLAQTMEEKKYRGIDIDFEYILEEDRDAFTAFVEDMTNVMNTIGYQVSVALAPKISDDQPGLLYAGKDYAALGAAANQVLLMTYEWGYKYGPPMAVAPINQVRRVVEYAISRIPNDKINLGIPNYGYDWPLPFERGVTSAETIGNIQAVQIAIEQGAEIEFDEVSKSPFFHYTQDGTEHEVWFEDVRSLSYKFDLIKEFSLQGAGYWQIMRWYRANWLLLADSFWIEK